MSDLTAWGDESGGHSTKDPGGSGVIGDDVHHVVLAEHITLHEIN